MEENFNSSAVNNDEFFNTTVSGVENVTKKKGKGKKIAIISGVSAAAVVGGGVALYNFSPFVKNQVKLRTMKPANYYAWVYEENSEDIAKKISDQYRLALGQYEDGNSSSVALRYTAGSGLKDYLLDELYAEFEGTDEELETIENIINNFESAEIGMSSASKLTENSGSVFAKYNGSQLASIEYAADMDAMDFFVRVPELTEKWIGVSLGTYMEENMENEDYELYQKAMDFVRDPGSYLSPEQLEDMIVRYVGIWTESVDGVKLKQDTSVNIAGMSVDYTAISVKLNEKDALEIMVKYLEEIRDDDVIRGIVIDELGVDAETYEEIFDEGIDELNEEIDEFDPDEDTQELKFTTYVDPKGVIRGFDFKAYDDGEELGEIFAAMGKDGDKVRGEFTFTDGDECPFTAELKATEAKDESLSGDITITVSDEAYDYESDDYVDKTYEITIDFDDYKVVDEEKGYFNCDLSIDLSEVIEDLDPIELRFETDGTSQEISYDISIDDTDYGTVTLIYSFDKSADISVPDTADAYMIDVDDPDFDVNEYVTEEELSDFIWNILMDIGFDEDYAGEIADEAAADVFSEINYDINGGGSYYDYY